MMIAETRSRETTAFVIPSVSTHAQRETVPSISNRCDDCGRVSAHPLRGRMTPQDTSALDAACVSA